MKVACVLDVNFEDSEFKQPYDAFTQAGHQVTIVGLEPGKELQGYRGRETTRSEKGIDEVEPDRFDALFIPGGYSPDHLRANPRAVAFAKAFFEDERPVFAV